MLCGECIPLWCQISRKQQATSGTNFVNIRAIEKCNKYIYWVQHEVTQQFFFSIFIFLHSTFLVNY